MCEFCMQHGEGRKWYLNARNYSQELLHEKEAGIRHFLANSHGEFIRGSRWIDRIAALPFIGKLILNSRMFRETLQAGVFGQVLPIEDVRRVFGFVRSVSLFPCICRQMSYNRSEEMYCFGVSMSSFEEDFLSKAPDVSGAFRKMDKQEALSLMEKMEGEGCYHSVWTMPTPFIGTICNCNGRDCISVRQRVAYGIRSFFKAEYVGQILPDSCKGCRECMKLCNFGAIKYSASLGTCSIQPFLCFGCGICRHACPSGAIRLEDRRKFRALEGCW